MLFPVSHEPGPGRRPGRAPAEPGKRGQSAPWLCEWRGASRMRFVAWQINHWAMSALSHLLVRTFGLRTAGGAAAVRTPVKTHFLWLISPQQHVRDAHCFRCACVGLRHAAIVPQAFGLSFARRDSYDLATSAVRGVNVARACSHLSAVRCGQERACGRFTTGDS